MKVYIYKGKGRVQPWRWRAVTDNNKVVSTGEGYFSKWNAKRAASKLYPDAEIKEEKPDG